MRPFPAPLAACFLVVSVSACAGSGAPVATPIVVASVPSASSAAAAAAGPSAASPGVTTPGRIACGTASCGVPGEFCFEAKGSAPRCYPRTDAQLRGSQGGEQDALYLCDDAADCATGERCCASTWGGTGPGYHECRADRCDDHEVCVPGGACGAGLHCAVDAGSPARATCVPADPGVRCGEVRCAGATPICCRGESGSARCVPTGSASASACGGEEVELQCQNQRDCGGYLCCMSLIGSTWCSSSCPGAAAAVACDSFGDCPPEGPGPAGIRQRYTRCEAGTCTGELCNPDGSWRRCDAL